LVRLTAGAGGSAADVVGVGTMELVGTRLLNWQASIVIVKSATTNDKVIFFFILYFSTRTGNIVLNL
jgi:hypothetical protein